MQDKIEKLLAIKKLIDKAEERLWTLENKPPFYYELFAKSYELPRDIEAKKALVKRLQLMFDNHAKTLCYGGN